MDVRELPSSRELKASVAESAERARSAAQRGALAVPALSVLMPVYNERGTLCAAIDRVLAAPISVPLEIVAVDDGSTDGSAQLLHSRADDHRIIVIQHERNRGKGAALRTAIAAMRGRWAVVQDADLEYDPRDLETLLVPLMRDQADAVYGSRFLAGGKVGSWTHAAANRWLTALCNRLTGLRLTDMETCYKLVRADLLRSLRLQRNGFCFEPELTMRLAQSGARIVEAPITYRRRGYVAGKKIRPRDGLKAVATMVRCRYFDRRWRADQPAAAIT